MGRRPDSVHRPPIEARALVNNANKSSSPRINSQAKGKRAERQLANWWKTHGFPDAHRAVVTGDRFAPDGGDLVLEHGGFRLVIEVKHHAGGLTDGQVTEYGTKLVRQIAQSKGSMGVLVERRDRVSDPARWWVHLDPADFAYLVIFPDYTLADWRGTGLRPLACRTTVGYFAELLRDTGFAEKG
jgi:hypothetical protein